MAVAAVDPKKVEPEVEIEVVELAEVASSIVVAAASAELAADTDPLT